MVADDHLSVGADRCASSRRGLETTNIPEHRFYLNCTMPFALAGFMEVEQQKPGVYHVKTFARNGQLLSQEVTNLPEAAAANAVYATGSDNGHPPPLLPAPPKDNEHGPE